MTASTAAITYRTVVTAVREKRRESVARFAVPCRARQPAEAATRAGDALQNTGRVRRKDDDVVATPRAASPGLGVTEQDRWPSSDWHSLQLSVCEESDVAAVRIPERKSGILGARNRVCVNRRDRPQP